MWLWLDWPSFSIFVQLARRHGPGGGWAWEGPWGLGKPLNPRRSALGAYNPFFGALIRPLILAQKPAEPPDRDSTRRALQGPQEAPAVVAKPPRALGR
jgi:hypothetical protein